MSSAPISDSSVSDLASTVLRSDPSYINKISTLPISDSSDSHMISTTTISIPSNIDTISTIDKKSTSLNIPTSGSLFSNKISTTSNSHSHSSISNIILTSSIIDSTTSDYISTTSISRYTTPDISKKTLLDSSIVRSDSLTTIPSISDKSTIPISGFLRPCEIGIEDKCLTCNNNKCSSCNPGYILKDGFCEADFFLKATYLVNSIEEDTKILDFYFNILNISEIIVDDQKMEPFYNTSFSKVGYHTIYFKFRNQISYYLNNFFKKLKI